MEPDPCDLSIVIPAWNEAGNLRHLLPLLEATLAELKLPYEIIVVDGGSSDDSFDVARQHGARFLTQSERGYGGALLAGFAAARADWILTMDADLSHQPDFIPVLWRTRASADVFIASRYVKGGRSDAGRFRALLSVILNVTFFLILRVPVRDMSSGFRMYRRDVLAGMQFSGRDFDALEEILVLAHVRGASIREVPFHYKSRGTGKSHTRLIRFGIAYLKALARLRRLRRTARA
jgi:dolichol-phosphate mannosyltransferase